MQLLYHLRLRSKKETIYVYMIHPISAFTFKVTHWITWYILTVISFYDRTCDHARVIQRYLSEYVISLNNHTCNLVCVTSKISFVALWLTFQGHTLDNSVHTNCHTLDNSVHTNCDLRCDLACIT